MPPQAQKPPAPDFIPADSAPDFIPSSGQQGPVRRFLTRAMDLPEGIFEHPGEYLNPFSRSYWHPSPEKQAYLASAVPSGKAPTLSEMIPGRQTLSDIKAENYAGAAGDVLPTALAVASMAKPAFEGYAPSGNIPRLLGREVTGRIPLVNRMEGLNKPSFAEYRSALRPDPQLSLFRNTPKLGDSPIQPVENRVMTPAGSAPAAEPTQSFSPKPLAEQPPAPPHPTDRPQGGYGLTAQSTEEILEPAVNTANAAPYGLTPKSFEDFQRLLAEPPEPAPNAGTVAAGKGPNWEDIANAGVGRQVSLARQMDLAGEGLPTPTAPTGEAQSLTDAMANFGVPDQSPVDMNPYYGKTRQTGMPTPHELLKPHQRQLKSPTFSTAPVPGPHPPEIMRILNTPGDIPEPDWSMLQDYFSRQRGAVSSGR